VRYTIVWETSALNTFKQLKASDPHAAKIITSAVNALAKNPEPAGSVKPSAATGGQHAGADEQRQSQGVFSRWLRPSVPVRLRLRPAPRGPGNEGGGRTAESRPRRGPP
jgi:hypothetical protein